jgi:hypothetical protein
VVPIIVAILLALFFPQERVFAVGTGIQDAIKTVFPPNPPGQPARDDCDAFSPLFVISIFPPKKL